MCSLQRPSKGSPGPPERRGSNFGPLQRPSRATRFEDPRPPGPSEPPFTRIGALGAHPSHPSRGSGLFWTCERHVPPPVSRIPAFSELEKAFFLTLLDDSGFALEAEKDVGASRCHFEPPLSRIPGVGGKLQERGMGPMGVLGGFEELE